MISTPKPKTYFARWTLCLVAAAALASCAGSGNVGSGPGTASGSRIESCKSTDQPISSRTQCLQDDAACYQISNGSWCTGERGNTCPAGSSALPAGEVCPAKQRCFRVSESLECMI